ncbi:hypothetical protein FQK07_09100 [Synechococcus sp. BSF8S]|uniref:hypothetical protein n=1 Tax=Synechococcales TaxID=1890424 RepID=UPI00162AC650|nr:MULTISPECIES: hypothetical protein [unclassified Synechococcus]MBC1261422.1 hypothetical protein [Synechococcus sp. BSF8S]MBC1264452.1 hypothetical protein [Synechococcus sp. BSA11S]
MPRSDDDSALGPDSSQPSRSGDEPETSLTVPATAPLRGPEGSLLYTGCDGRQYIVCSDPSQAMDQDLMATFQALRSGAPGLEALIQAARDWVAEASDQGLPPAVARRTLLSRLKQSLEEQ